MPSFAYMRQFYFSKISEKIIAHTAHFGNAYLEKSSLKQLAPGPIFCRVVGFWRHCVGLPGSHLCPPPGLSHPVEPQDDQVRGLPGEPTFELGAWPRLNTRALAADEPGVLSDGHGPEVMQDLPKI